MFQLQCDTNLELQLAYFINEMSDEYDYFYLFLSKCVSLNFKFGSFDFVKFKKILRNLEHTVGIESVTRSFDLSKRDPR